MMDRFSKYLNTETALSGLQQAFAGGQVRALPVDTDCMEPTMYKGEFAGVKPLSRYECEGVYVLEFDGCMVIRRAMFCGWNKIRIWPDNALYGGPEEITAEQFNDALLGRVIGHVGYIDRPRFKEEWTKRK